MVHLIVGHRGVGKSEFLKRIASYHQEIGLPCRTYDLDSEISLNAGMPITEIFEKFGEEHFRALEQSVLHRLVNELEPNLTPAYIALGAGYQGDLPMGAKVIWLRRRTDSDGRIFTDRPRLHPEMSPLDEYSERYLARAARYRHWHTKQITMMEGATQINEAEKALLSLKPANIEASVSLLPEHFQNEFRLEDFIADKLLLGVRYFELRDDLLSATQMDRMCGEIPPEKIIISFRTRDSKSAPSKWWSNHLYDWALELGPCPFGKPKVLSLHHREKHEGVREAIDRLMQHQADHYKLAIPIDSVMELWAGHAWYIEDPQHRSFLPMSGDGKWYWYRCLRGSEMRLNFVTDGEGTSFDQPTLQQWMATQAARGQGEFAAVLGHPVRHSRTPTEQAEFFKDLHMPVLAVDMSEEDCSELGLGVLRRLGLRAAAVTAPLKRKVAAFCEAFDGPSFELKAVNTLWWDEALQGWSGANTDVRALEKILHEMALPSNVVVWGGGGTRSTLMRLLPKARFFRARSGEELFDMPLEQGPDLVIWAVGRDRQQGCVWPSTDWRPLMILDLNYTENSPGREYALKVGATYLSGLDMFREQARFQREFWQSKRPAAEAEIPV